MRGMKLRGHSLDEALIVRDFFCVSEKGFCRTEVLSWELGDFQ